MSTTSQRSRGWSLITASWTLVGSGGVGKTRLAIEEAASLAPRFCDGVNLVDLSEVPDPALLWATVARTVGVEEKVDAELAERLMRILRPQSRLLVLDNCEQLLAETAAVAMQLLSSCPQLWILATSREGLGVPGEVTWRVPSLTFPWPGHQPALEEVEEFGAVALLIERARSGEGSRPWRLHRCRLGARPRAAAVKRGAGSPAHQARA